MRKIFSIILATVIGVSTLVANPTNSYIGKVKPEINIVEPYNNVYVAGPVTFRFETDSIYAVSLDDIQGYKYSVQNDTLFIKPINGWDVDYFVAENTIIYVKHPNPSDLNFILKKKGLTIKHKSGSQK